MRGPTPLPFSCVDVPPSTHLCLECGIDPIDFNSPICAYCRVQRECKEAVSDLSRALGMTPAKFRQLAELTDLALASTVDVCGKAMA